MIRLSRQDSPRIEGGLVSRVNVPQSDFADEKQSIVCGSRVQSTSIERAPPRREFGMLPGCLPTPWAVEYCRREGAFDLFRAEIRLGHSSDSITSVCMSETPTVGFRDAIAALEQLGVAFSRYDETGGRVLIFTGSKIDDRTLELAHHIPGVKRIDLRGTSITDAGLEHLKEMTDLEQIWLSGTRISGAGLARFQKLVDSRLRTGAAQRICNRWRRGLCPRGLGV